MQTKPLVSIIIPARNEGATIPTVLRSLSRQERISDCEVIVVDGMSTDNTATVAESFPFVRVLRGAKGRAVQMNRGAEIANAPALWFLHADTTLPDPNTVDALLGALRDPSVECGAFQFHLRGDDGYFRFVTTMVNFRARAMQRPFGDQGIFVRTATFHRIGGYRGLEFCEDLDLVLRLRRVGRFQLLPQTVETSARTWQAHGKLRITAWHLAVLARYEWKRLTGTLPPTHAEALLAQARSVPPAVPAQPADALAGDAAGSTVGGGEGVEAREADPARQPS